MKIKALHLVQGLVSCLGNNFPLSSSAQIAPVCFADSNREVSPAAASEKDFDVSRGDCCTLLVILLLSTTCHCLFPKTKIPAPHGP